MELVEVANHISQIQFQEHEELGHLLELLPRKAQKGLTTTNVVWTCIDADKNFIVLGANISLVYVYDRTEQDIIRLRPEDKSCTITCVELQSSLDFQIAVGTDKGHVELYLLPSKAPGRGKDVKKIFLKSIHKSKVTCACWSTNGMKLFTGDQLGNVVYTNIDFYDNHHQSNTILQEECHIVQLNYAYKALLVSTNSRTILCYTNEDNRCQQIGQQPRKMTGRFGAMFIPAVCKPSDAQLYATRPGLRMWKAKMDASVQETMLFKDYFLNKIAEIELLPDTAVPSSAMPSEIQFGQVNVLSEALVVVWSHSSLFILNPAGNGDSAVIGRCHGLMGNILDVAVVDDEIFVLREESKRPLIRLGISPEKEQDKDAHRLSDKKYSYLQSLRFPSAPAPYSADSSSVNSKAVFKEGINAFYKNIVKKAADEIADGAIKAKEDLERNARTLKQKLDKFGDDSSSSVSSLTVDNRMADFQDEDRADGGTEINIIATSITPDSVSSNDLLAEQGTASLSQQNIAMSITESVCTDLSSTITPRSISPLPESTKSTLNLQNLQEISQEKFDDIVFQPKVRKKKKKKKQVAEVKVDQEQTLQTSDEKVHTDDTHESKVNSTPVVNEDVSHGTLQAGPIVSSSVSSKDDNLHHRHFYVTVLHPEGKDITKGDITDSKREDEGNLANSNKHFNGDADKNHIEPQCTQFQGNKILNGDELQKFNIPKLNLSGPQPLRSYEDVVLSEHELPETERRTTRPYSVYQDIYGNQAPPATLDSLDERSSLPDVGEQEDEDSDSETESQELTLVEELAMSENLQEKLSSSWLQCATPGYILRLSASEKHVWCLDSREKVYFSLSTKIACSWNKLKGVRAKQLAVSPSGSIVWIVKGKDNCAYASEAIKSKIGSKWNIVCKNVDFVCLDDTTAWIVLMNGAVCIQSGITRDKPSTKTKLIENSLNIVEVVANRGVVWARTTEDKVIYRSDISVRTPAGVKWVELDHSEENFKAVSIALDSKHMGWAIDKEGRVWFRTGVNVEQPQGDDKRWWEVTMSEYLMEDPNVLKMMVTMAGSATKMDKVMSWLKSHQAVQVTANSSGVWICAQFQRRTTLQVSRGNLLGSSWELTNPVGLPTASCWVCVTSAAVYGPSGMVWAAQKSGEIFCFSPATRKPILVNPPESCTFMNISATANVLWALSTTGKVYLRVGISQHCPQGKEWKMLDTTQLGSNRIVHLSCGSENVWACDTAGNCYMRVGIDLPKHEGLPRAWLIVDSKPSVFFTQVSISPTDNMVWAIDSRKTVYSRMGVTDDLPVGLDWVPVEGTQAQELCISSDTVWALCPNGDIVCRFGTSQKNAEGNYWKKVPGNFSHISVTQSNDLWTITEQGQLYQRSTKLFKRQNLYSPTSGSMSLPGNEEDEEWELL